MAWKCLWWPTNPDAPQPAGLEPGEAHYYALMVNGDMLPDAVWYYPEPKPEAHLIQGRVAFWKGVKIEE